MQKKCRIPLGLLLAAAHQDGIGEFYIFFVLEFFKNKYNNEKFAEIYAS